MMGFNDLFLDRMMKMVRVIEMVKMMGRWAVVCRGYGSGL